MSSPSLPEPWEDLRSGTGAAADRAGLESEIRREATAGHVLHSKTFTVIARSTMDDDVLLKLEPDGWAVIHLTWQTDGEMPPWPHTVVYESLAAACSADS